MFDSEAYRNCMKFVGLHACTNYHNNLCKKISIVYKSCAFICTFNIIW